MLQYFLDDFFFLSRSLLSGTVERWEIIITTMKTRVILFVLILKVFQRIQVIIQFFDKCALSPNEHNTHTHLHWAHNTDHYYASFSAYGQWSMEFAVHPTVSAQCQDRTNGLKNKKRRRKDDDGTDSELLRNAHWTGMNTNAVESYYRNTLYATRQSASQLVSPSE